MSQKELTPQDERTREITEKALHSRIKLVADLGPVKDCSPIVRRAYDIAVSKLASVADDYASSHKGVGPAEQD